MKDGARDIKEVVKQEYGEAAVRVKSGVSSCCGASFGGGCGDPITSKSLRCVRGHSDSRRSVAGLARLRQSDRAGQAESRRDGARSWLRRRHRRTAQRESSLPSDCSRSFGDVLALGPRQSPLPRELISLRRIGSRRRLHLPIPRLHWPALPATRDGTFAGIRPADAPGFMVAQLTGTIAATLLFRWFGNATRFGSSTTEILK